MVHIEKDYIGNHWYTTSTHSMQSFSMVHMEKDYIGNLWYTTCTLSMLSFSTVHIEMDYIDKDYICNHWYTTCISFPTFQFSYFSFGGRREKFGTWNCQSAAVSSISWQPQLRKIRFKVLPPYLRKVRFRGMASLAAKGQHQGACPPQLRKVMFRAWPPQLRKVWLSIMSRGACLSITLESSAMDVGKRNSEGQDICA